MKINIHQKEQYDLGCFPLACVHVERTDSSTRVFCLWSGGIQVGPWYWQWSKP